MENKDLEKIYNKLDEIKVNMHNNLLTLMKVVGGILLAILFVIIICFR